MRQARCHLAHCHQPFLLTLKLLRFVQRRGVSNQNQALAGAAERLNRNRDMPPPAPLSAGKAQINRPFLDCRPHLANERLTDQLDRVRVRIANHTLTIHEQNTARQRLN